MRPDGRAADENREIRITPNFLPAAEGSALIETGLTKVICTASAEDGVPPFRKGTGLGWLTAEYAMLPRATNTRTSREVNRGRPSGRTSEIQRLIGRSLRAAVDFQKLGERTIFIDCDVLQADGGTRTAAISGGWVALALAERRLIELELLKQEFLLGSIAAVSVGVFDGVPVLDLNYEEDAVADVDMNVVMNGEGEYVEIQATAEHGAFSGEHLSELLALAGKGCRALLERQREAVGG